MPHASNSCVPPMPVVGMWKTLRATTGEYDAKCHRSYPEISEQSTHSDTRGEIDIDRSSRPSSSGPPGNGRLGVSQATIGPSKNRIPRHSRSLVGRCVPKVPRDRFHQVGMAISGKQQAEKPEATKHQGCEEGRSRRGVHGAALGRFTDKSRKQPSR